MTDQEKTRTSFTDRARALADHDAYAVVTPDRDLGPNASGGFFTALHPWRRWVARVGPVAVGVFGLGYYLFR